uniref:Putative secreted protein n=1 Tax=Anopheles triannulatus TaxID=58253 RepID=A0A2M4B3G0_9DIPT
MNWFSALMIVCRNFRYSTCRPWISMQCTKCCTTLSLTSLHRLRLSLKMLHTVSASRIPGFRNRSNCLCNSIWFCWLPRQKFCRNWWANRISSFIR